MRLENRVFVSKKTCFVLFIFSIFYYSVYAQPGGYGYGKMITIQGSKVPSTLTDFPVLISIQDNDLRTTTNGGHVYNNNGYDIVFYLTDCVTKLVHQIESYDPVTGTLVCWVKMPTLLGGTNSGLYMFYSNSLIAANPSSTTVWDANFVSRYHMSEPPNGVTTDFTGNANSSIANNMAAGDLIAGGKIGKAVQFNGSKYIQLPNSNNPGNNWTISIWIKSNQSDAGFHGIIGSDANVAPCCINRSAGLWVYQNTKIHGGFGNGSTWCSWVTGNTITNGAGAVWHHLVYTYNNTVHNMWVDGVLTYTNNVCVPSNPAINTIVYIGRRDNYYTGLIDEIGISKIVRSNAWITTEYNNQSNPATFYTITAEMTANAVCSLLPITLEYFNAYPRDGYVELNWKTATQINNDYFIIEKSKDAVNWQQIVMTKGLGTSYTPTEYIEADYSPYNSINYYRIKQVDTDGEYKYSGIVAVNYSNMVKTKEPIIYPNPLQIKEQLNIQFPSWNDEVLVVLRNMQGEEVFSKIILFEENNLLYGIPIEGNISPGIYLVIASNKRDILFSKKIIIK